MKKTILLEFLISFIINWFLIYINLPFFKKFFPDKPNQRSSHNITKPSGGGIIFVLTSSITFIINSNYYFLANSLLAIFGLVDDKLNLSATKRFFIQIKARMYQ